MPGQRFDPLTLLAGLPGASLVGLSVYVSRFDGWGAWGAAPLLLVPVFLSIPITFALALRWRRARETGAAGRSTLILALIAATPLVWLGWRLMVS